MIHKITSPVYIHQFRPISLCLMVYKAVANIMGNRMKPYLDYLATPQSSFVPSRFIVDNIIISHELIHSIIRKKGKKGLLEIEVDLKKAYDRLDWGFI